MALPDELKEVIRCPRCRGELEEEAASRSLFCQRCQLKYPISDGVPVMMVEEAVPTGVSVSAGHQRLAFSVTSGPDQGTEFTLDSGTCRAIGRAAKEYDKTSVFNLDLTLSLDEGTKSIILKYIRRQFGSGAESGGLGGFKRATDIALSDASLSKLHAMVFAGYDKVGILDLVSKNGTFVNGQEVESCFLRPGDVIELGNTKIIYEG